MTTSATDTELCPYTSIHKEKEKEKKKKKEEEEESAKDLKTLHRISKNLHRITMSRSPPLLLYQ
jgi:hypothetical protein